MADDGRPQNNHWDLAQNILSGCDKHANQVAIPARIGDSSKIKHVFVIIRENRTYDQMLGDVAAGNGQANLAVFGSSGMYGNVTPNAHASLERFPFFDNFYDPSRQSADGHNWIVQAMAPYPMTSSRRTGTGTIPPTEAMRLLISPRATCTTWCGQGQDQGEELRRAYRGEHLQSGWLHRDGIYRKR